MGLEHSTLHIKCTYPYKSKTLLYLYILSYMYVYILICFFDRNAYYYYYYYYYYYKNYQSFCIDVPRTFWARNRLLLIKLCFDIIRRLFLYVFLTMSNTCKEILLSDNNLTILEMLRLKSQRIKTTSPPSLDKYFVEPKRDLLDNLEWFTTQHRKENYKKKKWAT